MANLLPKAAASILLLSALTLGAQEGDTVTIIETIAGGNEAGLLNNPFGVAVDGAGNVYIADTDNHRVRRVDARTRKVSTFAGVGAPGFSGDGGPAMAARLRWPWGVAVDAIGNVYIADTGNGRVRRVDASSGNISSIVFGATGVAVDGSGNVYATNGAVVYKMDASSGNISTIAGTGTYGFSGDGGPATSAQLNLAIGVAVDGSGNVYIADANNGRVRRVDVAGNISTFAGGGTVGTIGDGGPATSATVNQPWGVAVDSSGNVYIAAINGNRVRRVDASTGNISTFAGSSSQGFGGDGGPATAARLFWPRGVAVDGSGNVYITDSKNHRVRRVDAARNISTIAGMARFGGDGGPATSAVLNSPNGVAVGGSGNVYIADRDNHRVRRVDASTGHISTFAGTGTRGFGGDGGPAPSARLWSPEAVVIDDSGNVYIAESSRVRRVDASTGHISTFAGTGTSGFSGDGGPATSAQLRGAFEVAVDDAGNVYIADSNNYRIRKVDLAGTISTVAGTGTSGFSGDGGPATSAQLSFPNRVAVDGSGNVYITDGNRVRRVDASTGRISTFAGTGTLGYSGDGGLATSAQLSFPNGVAVDSSNNVYIADGNRVRRVDASTGRISTFVGSSNGNDRDGGPATAAQLSGPKVAVDFSGNVYIADTGNHRVRRTRQIKVLPPPNEPPEVSLALPDAAFSIGQARRLSLINVFMDPDGDALTWQAQSSAPGVVEASVVGNALVLRGVADGMATVTVFATDAAGATAQQTFTVTIGTVLSLVGEAAAAEGGVARLSVSLSRARSSAAAFSWRVLADADPATADADVGEHGGASGTGVIAAGRLEAAIEVPIADDDSVEPAREWFLVEIAAEGDDPVALGRVQAPVAVLEGVCDRTPVVAAVLAPADACETATAESLAARRALWLDDRGLAELREGDMDGLTGLSVLALEDNALTALPPGLLSETRNLRFLRLDGNGLAALPGDALAGLGALEELDLSDNALTALPDGLFAGVRSLRRLNLAGNPGAPFPLEVGLRRADAPAWAAGPAMVEVVLAPGAPFPVDTRVTAGGSDEDMPVSLAAGETVGGPLEIAPSGDEPTRLTVTVGNVPNITCNDRPCWDGLTLSAGEPLLLFAQPPMAADAPPTPEPLFGTELTLPLESLVTVGSLPVVGWEASSSNPAVAVAVRDGMLVVTPDLGAEGTAEIELTVTDAEGQTATAHFTIEVEFHWPGGIVDGWRGTIISTVPATSTPE